MAKLAMSVGGALIGGAIGGPTGAKIGWTLGNLAGNALFSEDTHTYGPKLGDLRVTSSAYGNPIPTVYGTYRIAGNIIWSTGIKETANTQDVGGKGGPSQTHTTYTYSCSFALGLCTGEIAGIRKIWADSKLIYNKSDEATVEELSVSGQTGVTIYTGSETQLPDSTIEATQGSANTPAFRGLAYIVFSDLQLAKYGNRIPNITCEVVEAGNLVAPNVQESGTANQATAGGGRREFQGLKSNTVLYGTRASRSGTTVTVYETEVDMSFNETVVNTWQYDIVSTWQLGNIMFFPRCDTVDPQYFAAWNNHITNGKYDIVLCKRGVGIIDSYGGSGSIYDTYAWNPKAETVYTGEYIYFSMNDQNSAGRVVRIHVSTGVSTLCSLPSSIVPGTDFDSNWPIKTDGNYVYIGTTRKLSGISTAFVCRYPVGSLTPDAYFDTPTPDIQFEDVVDGVCYFQGDYNSIHTATFADQTFRHIGTMQYAAYKKVSAFRVSDEAFVLTNTDHGVGVETDLVEFWASYMQVGTALLSDIITSLCAEAGIPASSIDVSELTTTLVKGYSRTRSMGIKDAIAPLLNTYDLTAVESDYKLKFELKHGNYDKVIEASDLAATAGDGKLPDELLISRIQDTDIPRRTTVSYSEEGRNYEPGVQYAQRIKT